MGLLAWGVDSADLRCTPAHEPPRGVVGGGTSELEHPELERRLLWNHELERPGLERPSRNTPSASRDLAESRRLFACLAREAAQSARGTRRGRRREGHWNAVLVDRIRACFSSTTARVFPARRRQMQSTAADARSAAHVCSHLLAPRPIVAVGRGLPEHRALFPSITARMRRLHTLVLARTEGHARQSPHDRRRMLVAEAQAKAEAARATEALTALFADALLAQLRGAASWSEEGPSLSGLGWTRMCRPHRPRTRSLSLRSARPTSPRCSPQTSRPSAVA
jgi:hypothetical protein